MTLQEIIEIADIAYDDDLLVRQYYDDLDGEFGDTLARFVAVELMDTYVGDDSDEEQLKEACRVMDRASTRLLRISEAFDEELDKRMQIGKESRT